MEGTRARLVKEQERLEMIVRKLKPRLDNAPEGKLRLSRSHGCPQFYYCTKENKVGVYIGKENQKLIKILA